MLTNATLKDPTQLTLAALGYKKRVKMFESKVREFLLGDPDSSFDCSNGYTLFLFEPTFNQAGLFVVSSNAVKDGGRAVSLAIFLVSEPYAGDKIIKEVAEAIRVATLTDQRKKAGEALRKKHTESAEIKDSKGA